MAVCLPSPEVQNNLFLKNAEEVNLGEKVCILTMSVVICDTLPTDQSLYN